MFNARHRTPASVACWARTPARHAVPEDRLHPEHRRLRQRPLVVARLLLPRRPTDLADAAEVLVPGQPGAGGVAMPLDLRIPPGRDHRPGRPAAPGRRTPPAGRTPHPPAALSTGFSTCSSRAGTVSASVTPGSRHHRRLDLVRLRVDGQVELQPGPPLGVAVLADLPLALAVDLQPGAVEDQVERPLGLLGQRDPDGGGPAAEGGVIGHGQVHLHQLEERAGEPLGGPQGEVVDGPERQQALDGQVAVLGTGPPAGPAPGIATPGASS